MKDHKNIALKAPEKTFDGYLPTTPDKLTSQATVGALLAIFGCADNLLRQGKMDKRLHQKMGIPALTRCYNEVDRMNRHFENMWQTREADQMGFLHNDAAIIMMVLASVDLESRTNLSNEFRKVWAMLLEGLGDSEAIDKMLATIRRIREERQLIPREVDAAGDVFDHLTFFTGEEKQELGNLPHEKPTATDMMKQAIAANQQYYTEKDYTEFAQEQNDEAKAKAFREQHAPNCMVFVRDEDGIVGKALVLVQTKPENAETEGMLVDKIDYDSEGIYERFYPTGQILLFTVLADGYLPGGREKYFYADDTDQLVVNIHLTKIPDDSAR